MDIGTKVETRSVIALQSGGYALAGVSYSPSEKYRAVLVKTDKNGKKEWNLTLVKTEGELFTVVIENDTAGNIILAATHKFNSYKGEQEIYVAKITPEGKILWEKFVGGAGSRQVGGIVVTADNQILITGYVDNLTPEHKPMIYCIKVKND